MDSERLDNRSKPEAKVLIISDVRYPNEVKAIRDRSGVVVKVVRPGIPESDDVADCALAGMKAGEWDRFIFNDGDYGDLADKSDFLAQWIVRRLAMRDA